jgi:hypothetical protein
LAIQVLPLDTLFECLKDHASELGGQDINLFDSAVKKSKSDLLDYYLRPNLLVPGHAYIYIAEDKGGKGSRPNYDPGNTFVALANPQTGLAFPGRWGLFTNPLGWVEIDAQGPRPSDRPTNIGFCVFTLEFDQIPLPEQLKAIWDGGIGRSDRILRCFRDYRGYEVIYGGRKSLHYHFVFDLRHWKHELAFANNSSYQENWLADFPDRYLREAHQDCWAKIMSAFRLGTKIEADPDAALQNWEQNRRVPLALRQVQDAHPLGLPAGVYVPQYVLASKVRRNIPREAKGWLHESNLIGPSAVRYAQRHGKRKTFEDARSNPSIGVDPLTLHEQHRFDQFLIDNFPKLAVGTGLRYGGVEFGTQGPKVFLHNNSYDKTPSSVIQGDYKSVLRQGGHDFDRTTYPLAVSPNRLLAAMIEQEGFPGAELAHLPNTSEADTLMQKFETEVHDCESYRRFLSEHIVTAMAVGRLVLILGPEGCGKSSAVMANIGRLIEDSAEPFGLEAGYEPVFISSPSYEQAAEKIRQFNAMHATGLYVAYEYLSLTELY